MKLVSIADLKTHAPKILKSVQAGEPVVVTNRNKPVARLTSYGGRTNRTRIGFDPGVKISGNLTEPVLDPAEGGDLSLP